MTDQTPNLAGDLSAQDIVDLTQRPSDAYNEVVLQADYTTRAALSFYRFRQLGGDYHVPSRRKTSSDNTADSKEEPSTRHPKLKLGLSGG